MHRLISLALVALLFQPSEGLGQSRRVPFDQGTHVFRHILHQLELQPLADLGDSNPTNTIVIVFGDTEAIPRGLEGFLKNGGAVLIASDRLMQNGLFGVEISGEILVETTEKYRYRGLEKCPLIAAVSRSHPLFQGITPGDATKGLATNRPSFLSGDLRGRLALPDSVIGEMTILASFSNGCVVEGRGNDGTRFAFAAAKDSPDSGRALVLSDHSVFINDMMLQADNKNFEFAYNCVQWLIGPDKQRQQVLFLDEGVIVTDFSVPLKEVPDIPLPELDILVNQLLPELEKSDVFNQLIMQYVSQREIWHGWVLSLTLTLAAYGLFRFMRNRHRFEAGLTPLAEQKPQSIWSASGEPGPESGPINGSTWEAARELARQCFGDRDASAGDKPPRVEVQGGWRRRWKFQQYVRGLWRLARATRPRPISKKQFALWARRAQEVKNALADRSLRLHDL